MKKETFSELTFFIHKNEFNDSKNKNKVKESAIF